MCNKIFEYFIENDLISHNQLGFKRGDSCINQLLSTHEIYKSFHEGYETRGVFLEISKSFDKVWHEGLLHKLKENGISGKLLNIVKDLLYQGKQRVVLNGQYSSWTAIEARVPQASIFGPLLFLIYINDLFDDLAPSARLFADDTSLFSVVENMSKLANELKNDLAKIST